MRPALLLAIGLLLAGFVPATGHAQPGSEDLAVVHVDWDQLVDGDDTRFNATVVNDGGANWTSDFNVTFDLEDEDFENEVEVELEEPIEPGESRNVSASEDWDAEYGNYTINATVKEGDDLPGFRGTEENDYENRSFAFGPDIVTHQASLEPSSPIGGEEVTFSAEIENVASDDYDIQDPFIVEFEIVDGDETVETIESEPIQQLRSKDPKTVEARAPWDAEAGSYTLRAVADADDNVTETDPGNNTAERAFSVTAAEPDLVVTDVSPANPRVQAGEGTPIEATIANEGTSNVTDDFPVRFRVNGTTHGPDVHVDVGDGLQPGGEVAVESAEWLATEGHHDLAAIADPGDNNVTNEASTANNDLASDLHVGPDLVVDDILWTPDPPAAGHEVSIDPVIRNQGTGDVDQTTTVNVTIPSADETWTSEVAPLEAGNATQVHVADWTPPEQETGDEYPYEVDVEAEADIDDEATEVDEDNNALGQVMEVTEPRPDIVTADAELDPASPETDEETHVEATIRNNGSADASEVEVQFLVDGEQLGDTKTIAGGQFDSLEADGGEQPVRSDAWNPEIGEHEITVHPYLPSDGADEIREDNNNETLEALVGPDAQVDGIALSPEQPEAEDEVTFEIAVSNPGSEAVDEMDVDVEVDGEAIGNRTVEDLAAGEDRNLTVSWTATEGDHAVRAVADPDEEITEARETNNEGEESFSTTASPDIQATSVRWSEDPRAGDKLVFTATVANTGTADVEGSFEVTFEIGDEVVGTRAIEGLDTGNSKSVSSDAWTADAGTHTVAVTSDAGDDVTEGDEESNNDRTALVTVDARGDSDTGSGPANLVVTEISAPDEIAAGDQVTFLATIENEGGEPANASDVRFLVDGDVLGEPSIEELSPGQRQSVASDDWNVTRGEHEITAIADVGDAIAESDEDDNDRVKRIEVGPTGDDNGTDTDEGGLTLGAVQVDQPRAGEPVRPTVEVTNEGDEARDVTVTFYVDGTRLGQGTLQDLGAGQQRTLEGPIWEPSEGEHTVTAEAGDQRSEALVDVAAGEDSDVPGPGLLALLATVALVARLRHR